MTRKKFITVFVVFLVLLAGCSSGGSSTSTNGTDKKTQEAFHGNGTHPQDPGEKTVVDTYHYENGSSKTVVYDTREIEKYVFQFINEYRQNQSAMDASVDPSLESSASAKSYHMVQNGYYAHTSPGGLTKDDFINSVGQCNGNTGENLNGIGVGEPSVIGEVDSNKKVARHIFEQWKNSDEGHREVMISDGANPSDFEMGVGVYITPRDGSDETYIVYATLHNCG